MPIVRQIGNVLMIAPEQAINGDYARVCVRGVNKGELSWNSITCFYLSS